MLRKEYRFPLGKLSMQEGQDEMAHKLLDMTTQTPKYNISFPLAAKHFTLLLRMILKSRS
jgi:hypothetical protein